MHHSTAHEDLAYVRAIAEEGRNVPLVGGYSFVVWGSIIGTAAFIQYLMVIGVLPMVRNSLWIWGSAMILGWGVGAIVSVKIDRTPGASSIGNRVVNAAWSGCGIFITLYFLSLLVAFFLLPKDGPSVGWLFVTMFPVVFGLYGLAFYVTAVAANQNWFRWVSIGSWAISAILLLTMKMELMMLIAALGTYAVVLVPGIAMVKSQPSEIV